MEIFPVIVTALSLRDLKMPNRKMNVKLELQRLAWVKGQRSTAGERWEAVQLTVKDEERNLVHAFKDALAFLALYCKLKPVSLPLFCWTPLPYGGLIRAWWENLGLERREPREDWAQILATDCPLPTQFLAMHTGTIWVYITGELGICSFREHNLGPTFLIYIE